MQTLLIISGALVFLGLLGFFDGWLMFVLPWYEWFPLGAAANFGAIWTALGTLDRIP